MDLTKHPAVVEAAREILGEIDAEYLKFESEREKYYRHIIAAAVAKVNEENLELLDWAYGYITRKGGVHDSDEYGVRMYAACRAALCAGRISPDV